MEEIVLLSLTTEGEILLSTFNSLLLTHNRWTRITLYYFLLLLYVYTLHETKKKRKKRNYLTRRKEEENRLGIHTPKTDDPFFTTVGWKERRIVLRVGIVRSTTWHRIVLKEGTHALLSSRSVFPLSMSVFFCDRKRYTKIILTGVRYASTLATLAHTHETKFGDSLRD